MGPGRGSGYIDTLRVERNGLGIKIEVNPVLRGTLHPPATLPIRAAAESHFGFTRMAVLAYEDLYAGKLVAALDRQHPRDLFDIKLLLEGGGIPDSLFRAFLVYLVGHKGVIAQTLEPRRKDISTLYRDQLVDMLAQPVSLDDLVEARERLISAIHARLGEREKRFLLSVKRMEPNWELLGVPAAASLPAVRWKLHNLAQMGAAKHKAALENLERVLDRIGK
jgi:predicted nucleotidyltransferase component of viral defense system